MNIKHLLPAVTAVFMMFYNVSAQNTFPSSGNVGIGTTSPVLELHLKKSDTPGIRLEQSSAGGYAPQTWDIAGNEANFFIRDVTHASKLCFRIQPGAPNDALTIKQSGYVGIGTWSPAAMLDVLGTIKIGYTSLTPVGGMIQFQDSTFEGFDGKKWRSFTTADSTERASIVNQSVDSTVEKLTTLNTDLTNKIQNLQDQIDTINQSYDSTVARLTTLNTDLNSKMQYLQDQIDTLQSHVNALSSTSAVKTVNATVPSVMLQNRPNPFNGNTLIEYHLATVAHQAMINVYNLSGKQVLSYPLASGMEGSVEVSSDQLEPGMYLYSLIVNGNAVESKKMIVTK